MNAGVIRHRLSLAPPMLAVLISGAIWTVPAIAQSKGSGSQSSRKAVSGETIASAARDTRLNTNESIATTISFTPVDFGNVRNIGDLAAGKIVGLLETSGAGAPNLPAGKYNLFIVRVAGKWHIYAESGGKIVSEATQVRISGTNKPDPKNVSTKPAISLASKPHLCLYDEWICYYF